MKDDKEIMAVIDEKQEEIQYCVDKARMYLADIESGVNRVGDLESEVKRLKELLEEDNYQSERYRGD